MEFSTYFVGGSLPASSLAGIQGANSSQQQTDRPCHSLIKKLMFSLLKPWMEILSTAEPNICGACSIAGTISLLIINSDHYLLIQNSAGHEVTKPAYIDQLGC